MDPLPLWGGKTDFVLSVKHGIWNKAAHGLSENAFAAPLHVNKVFFWQGHAELCHLLGKKRHSAFYGMGHGVAVAVAQKLRQTVPGQLIGQCLFEAAA